jgi:predicted DNA-binding transcriptional regulator AlpA
VAQRCRARASPATVGRAPWRRALRSRLGSRLRSRLRWIEAAIEAWIEAAIEAWIEAAVEAWIEAAIETAIAASSGPRSGALARRARARWFRRWPGLSISGRNHSDGL